jgi:hypothetical protein
MSNGGDGFWAVMFLAALGLSAWEAKLYYFDPDGTATTVVEKCSEEHGKVFELEIAK